jgi:anti-anti-sigma factor
MFSVQESEGWLAFTFKSRLDTETCSKIESEMIAHLEKASQPILFNIAQVDFVSSAFLRICIMAAKRAANGKFHVKNATPQIKKVFKIAGMDQFLAE